MSNNQPESSDSTGNTRKRDFATAILEKKKAPNSNRLAADETTLNDDVRRELVDEDIMLDDVGGVRKQIQASVSVPCGVLPAGAALQLPINDDVNPTIDTINIGVPSECLLLKNMFDPKLETEPDFDLEIKEDVQEECSKYGKLKHIFVHRDSAGFVYLRFEGTQGAINAQRNLHGRWFAAKTITATFMAPETYEAKFPDTNR
ncbi:hypothetical protein COLO4_31728 [Corchorus olitorius]|uniref:RRM domain-containing protein n=1 Tax=Corchorus olitorius TaxID=93759 RepID=A0A1R3H3H1_9ROSI|nr:hypothetical protein COLO4_31728 [Corchorus olitorius]